MLNILFDITNLYYILYYCDAILNSSYFFLTETLNYDFRACNKVKPWFGKLSCIKKSPDFVWVSHPIFWKLYLSKDTHPQPYNYLPDDCYNMGAKLYLK